MEHVAAGEERIVSERLRRRLEEVNITARDQLSPIQDHVNFTLQKAYFKCAYECFDRKRRQEDINNCVEYCSVPVLNANNLVETEMEKFQERLQRALIVCQDKFEAAKLQQTKAAAMGSLESCVDRAINESIQVLPLVVDRLRSALSLSGP
ncbi:unnamed protein product [Spirodela intermedia]|uniref:Uncharacterized protein n=1 Tax=Spirodela intermedia TaxID=51605 RepID=A0A7I8L5Z6_SPIIN|nr:unnamed protein product [Spirodela intermedia]